MQQFTQGDSVVLSFTALDQNGNPITLTGASFSSQIKQEDGTIATYDNSHHTANADQVNNKGVYTLTLSSVESALVDEGSGHEVVTEVTIAGVVTYCHFADELEVMLATPVS